jgi:hypothetical protein
VITAAQSQQALAIACPVCGSPPALRCTGLLGPIGHAARWHELASLGKPEPDAAAIAHLTATPGRRDPRPFVHWMDGRHDFRSAGRPGTDLTMVVYRDGQALPGTYVRRALIDLAARHGLVVLSSTSGRGTYAVTPRGVAFAESCRAAAPTPAAPTPAPASVDVKARPRVRRGWLFGHAPR